MKTTKNQGVDLPKPPLCERCGKLFTPRRKKRFCSGICRSAKFNEQNRDPKSPKAIISRILQKNDRILQRLFRKTGQDRRNSLYDILLYEGFNFNYYTQQEVNPSSGNVTQWMYEYGLELNSEGYPFWIHRRNLKE